jgi:hypothetical protein
VLFAPFPTPFSSSAYMARPTRVLLKILAAVLVLLFLVVQLQSRFHDSLPFLFRWQSKGDIPNIVHYVWTLPDPTADLRFEFKHFLSIYAARHIWRPETIYLHTNAAATVLARARAGSCGKWSKLIATLPGLKISSVAAPTHAGNGVEIIREEHKTDFLRTQILRDMGGVYIDFDVFALRDIQPLRESGFAAVVGRMEGRQLQTNSGTILSRKGSKMVTLYLERMHAVYDGKYTTHSNILLTAITERLVREPRQVLLLDQNAFTPGSWLPKHLSMIWQPQAESSNLEGVAQGDRLTDFSNWDVVTGGERGGPSPPSGEEWDLPENLSEGWERHFWDSYMLHGFQPGVRNISPVEGFDGVSPRYILERRSNFARALYGVVKDMYDKGLVRLDDGYDGH